MLNSTALKLDPLDQDNVWSVANGRLRPVDLTTDMLSDFETYKKQAEALYGTPEDPYRNPTTDKVIYAYRFTDIDPASWDPQWEAPSDTGENKSGYGLLNMAAVQKRMNALLSLNDESGPKETSWASRVFHSWLEKQSQTSSVGTTQDQKA